MSTSSHTPHSQETSATSNPVGRPVEPDLDNARRLLTVGDWAAAEPLCLGVLHEHPGHPRASYLLGLVCLQTARYDEALTLIRVAVDAHPEEPDYHNSLADTLRARGDTYAAMSAYRITLLLEPGHSLAHNNLGLLKYEGGDLPGAVAAFEAALVGDPRNCDFRTNLGVALREIGRFEESIECLGVVLRSRPDDAQALHNLSLALKALGDLPAAANAARAASRFAPEVAPVFANLADILQRTGDLAAAQQACRDALRLAPRETRYHDLWAKIASPLTDVDKVDVLRGQRISAREAGVAELSPVERLRKESSARESALYLSLATEDSCLESLHTLVEYYASAGDAAAAIAACTKGLRYQPEDTMFLAHRGIAHSAQGDLELAIADLDRAACLDTDSAFIHNALGDALHGAGQMQTAEDAYRHALALDPDRAATQNNLGAVLLSVGEIDEARACFQRALGLDPALALAWKNLSAISGPSTIDVSSIERLRALIAQPGLPTDDMMYLHFALAKMLDDVGQYDQAFEHYASANELGGTSARYDHDQHTTVIDRVIEQFTRERLERGLPGASDSDTPVFIIGMPRSGSTLVEQILSSHPQVGGAGEFRFFELVRFGQRTYGDTGAHYSTYLAELGERDVLALTESYLRRLRRDAPSARHVTDKLLSNYIHLGMIAMTFPRAHIIHCQRDAMDTCVSIFFRELPNVAFSWDLFNIGRHYREYSRLMSHWDHVLGERVYPVRYEHLVRDTEATARRLVERCGLKWDDRCLEFYQNKRTVLTNSVWQVRQPIYTHAVERWKRYSHHLDPLRSGLRDAGT